MDGGFPQLLYSRIDVSDSSKEALYLLDIGRRFEAVDSDPGFRWCNWTNTDIDVDRELSDDYIGVLGR